MPGKFKWVILSVATVFYALLYLATTKDVPVSDFCSKSVIAGSMLSGRSYVYVSGCCTDTALCVHVKDTTGIDWNLLADTACTYLHNEGLDHYRVFVIRHRSTGNDTVVNKKCP